jgi:hypothetical protein
MMELLAVLQCADDSGEDEGEADEVDGTGVGAERALDII